MQTLRQGEEKISDCGGISTVVIDSIYSVGVFLSFLLPALRVGSLRERPEKRRANSGFTRAGRSSASINEDHSFGEAANSRLSARTCSACKHALSSMKS